MSGECKKCCEHCLDCKCELNENIGCDDNQDATIVNECLQIMKDYPTLTNMAACYTLTRATLAHFCATERKENVIGLLDEFHNELREYIEEFY